MPNHAELDHLVEAALIWIAAAPEALGAFLAQTGLAPHDLRRAAQDPDFAESLIDFLCAEDARVLAFAEASGVRPERIAYLQQALVHGALGRR